MTAGWLRALVLCALSIASTPLVAELRVAKIFGDHMVLQQSRTLPIWGWADPGAVVTVEFGGQKKSASTDDKGAWRVELDPLPSSTEGGSMTIRAETTITLRDVVVGEVWLASGQSNMGYRVRSMVRSLDPARQMAREAERLTRGPSISSSSSLPSTTIRTPPTPGASASAAWRGSCGTSAGTIRERTS